MTSGQRPESSILAVVNPAAGGGRCRALAPAALDRLRRAGLMVEVVQSERPGQARALAQAGYQRGIRDFVAVGGDGTAHEVINGLLPDACSDDPARRVSVGFLPLGTGNSFLRDFSVGSADDAIDALVAQRRRACDVLRLTHGRGELFFINILSLGFVADVATTANRRFKRLGPAGYAVAVVVETIGLSPRSLRFRCDGGPWRQEPLTFVSINNSRYTGGGMMMAPAASTCDGRADVIIAGCMGRLSLLSAFPRIFAGTHLALQQLSSVSARRVELDAQEPLALMVDGEVVTETPKAVDVLPAAIDLCV